MRKHAAWLCAVAALVLVPSAFAQRTTGTLVGTVTDDSGANPWDTLPAYWTNEVNYVQSRNAAEPGASLELVQFTNGTSLIQINGAPGVYELQAGTNLASWSPIGMAGVPTNTGTFADPTAASFSRRFYRTRQ